MALERRGGRGVEGQSGGWDGRRRGIMGDGERRITMCCWSQGVTMVIGERQKEMGVRETGSTLMMQIDISPTD